MLLLSAIGQTDLVNDDESYVGNMNIACLVLSSAF